MSLSDCGSGALRSLLEGELEWAARAAASQSRAAQAYARLVLLAETCRSGQIRHVARFLSSTYGDAWPFDLFELRRVEVAISDDMLVCLDALRWGRADLHKLIPNGKNRVGAVMRNWGLQCAEEPA